MGKWKFLTPEKMYRLAYTMDDPKLRGKVVVFKGYKKAPHDIRRAVVHELAADGGLGQAWEVQPGLVIPL